MVRPPPRPTGRSNEARVWQWLYDFYTEQLPKIAPGVHLDVTTRGVFKRIVGLAQVSSSEARKNPLAFHPFFNLVLHPTIGNIAYAFGYWYDSDGQIFYWNTEPVLSATGCDRSMTEIQALPYTQFPVVQHTGRYAKFVNPFTTPTTTEPRRFRAIVGSIFVDGTRYPQELLNPGTPYFSYNLGDRTMIGEFVDLTTGQSFAMPIINKNLRDVAFFFISGGGTTDSPPAPYPIPPGRLIQ